jgi:uncharacterized C2H2 Zn-finger protein
MTWTPSGYGYDINVEGDDRTDSFYVKQPCPYCGRLYRTRSGVTAHIENKHGNEASKIGL